MKKVLVFCLLCFTSFAQTNTSPTNFPYINNIDILNIYTESNYHLKTTNDIILTGEFVKDFNLNRITSFTTLKIEF